MSVLVLEELFLWFVVVVVVVVCSFGLCFWIGFVVCLYF